MSATVETPPHSGPSTRRPRLLHGMVWAVWRQHRTAFAVLLAAAAAGAAWMTYQRFGTADLLHQGLTGEDLRRTMKDAYGHALEETAGYLVVLPLAIGVFLGAPLVSGDREHGTDRLMTTQSVTRGRWIATKLGVTVAVVLLSTGLLSAAFTWWWHSARPINDLWDLGGTFDTTGPVLPALCLLYLAVGIAIGALARRMLTAMVLTAVAGYGLSFVWDRIRLVWQAPRVLTSPITGTWPQLPDGAVEHDRWLTTDSGRLYGWGNCIPHRNPEPCLKEKGITGYRLEYFGFDQMSPLQWTGAAVLLAVAVALLGAVLWWIRRRPL
ncbi:ABC transporter permease [Streptomyces gamaensis]|uniref:ABC transporter permease n=1 Tax=Streptomyces gamaensis TaxID=1763542 RepID=A0ABW0Z4W0_9ACTN